MPVENANGKHYRNLQGTNGIEIDGKKYVKVNLRFVDTLDKDATKLLLNLEAENELLKLENDKFIKENHSLIQKIKDIETLNINLYAELKVKKEQNKSTVKKLREAFLQKELHWKEEAEKINENLDKYKEIIFSNQKALEEKNKSIKSKNSEIQDLWTIVKQKDNENQTFLRLLSESKEHLSISELKQKKNSELIENYEKKLAIKDKTICDKDLLIKTLTNNLFEREKKISELLNSSNQSIDEVQ